MGKGIHCVDNWVALILGVIALIAISDIITYTINGKGWWGFYNINLSGSITFMSVFMGLFHWVALHHCPE